MHNLICSIYYPMSDKICTIHSILNPHIKFCIYYRYIDRLDHNLYISYNDDNIILKKDKHEAIICDYI